MVPHTSDGRVLFAIPWHGHTVVGTTDTPIEKPSYDPLPMEQEIDFILETAERYLSRPPRREDILSVLCRHSPSGESRWIGLRQDRRALARSHHPRRQLRSAHYRGRQMDDYRHMAEDCVDHAITLGRLDEKPCVTRDLHIHGYREEIDDLGTLWVYGSDAEAVLALAASDASLAAQLDPSLPYIAAEVVWAAREEMARTVDDVLSRRTRALFLNARAAQRMIEPCRRIAGTGTGP